MLDDYKPFIMYVFYAALVIIIIDELAFKWWKNAHPGGWYGVKEKHPLNLWSPAINDNYYANGYRPGGGINVAG